MPSPATTTPLPEDLRSRPLERILWRVTAVAATVLAAIAGRAALQKGWTLVTSEEPPLNPAAADTDLRDALLFTAATGAAVGVARMGARRGAAEAWKAAMGEFPPQVLRSA